MHINTVDKKKKKRSILINPHPGWGYKSDSKNGCFGKFLQGETKISAQLTYMHINLRTLERNKDNTFCRSLLMIKSFKPCALKQENNLKTQDSLHRGPGPTNTDLKAKKAEFVLHISPTKCRKNSHVFTKVKEQRVKR